MGRAALVVIVCAVAAGVGGYALGSAQAESKTRTEMSAEAVQSEEVASADLAKRGTALAACGKILTAARDFTEAHQNQMLDLYDSAEDLFYNLYQLGTIGDAEEAQASSRGWYDSEEVFKATWSDPEVNDDPIKGWATDSDVESCRAGIRLSSSP
jgi:hypothetical protein